MKEAVNPASTGGPKGGRVSRYARVDLAGITVRKAVTEADFELVGHLRQAGFSRVADNAATAWVDDFDRSPGVFSLIAYNSLNEPVATMRVQDGRVSELELARFIPLDTLLNEEYKPAVQCARLSVIKGYQSTDAIFGSCKAVWLWCLSKGLESIVLATPPWSKPIYDFMLFDDLGTQGHFPHKFVGGTLHITMALSVRKAETVWRKRCNPLCRQMFDVEHPSLILE